MNYFYIFEKGEETITVSGTGEDPHDVSNIRWSSSNGAKGVLDQIKQTSGGYSPTHGFVSFNDYKTDMYVQIGKFSGIYKDGWRFQNTNLSSIEPEPDMMKNEIVEKSKTKRYVYVKASKGRKAHYRMQDVGREEIDPDDINNLWEISLDQFRRLCTGDKTSLKEQYMDDHKYYRGDKHPELVRLCSIMSDDMQASHYPYFVDFFEDPKMSLHEKAVEEAVFNDGFVPLRVLKDYPDLAKAYGMDTISEAAIEDENRTLDLNNADELKFMTKGEYDNILTSVKNDFDRNPKKITDKVLKEFYPEQLADIKHAAKFRKKLFESLPKDIRIGYQPNTMNIRLHKEMVLHAKNNNLPISNEVKAGYPTIFTEMPFNYESTGNEECDNTINDILTTIRNDVGVGECDRLKLQMVVNRIIGSDGRAPSHYTVGLSDEEEELIDYSLQDVGSVIGPDLMNQIEQDGTPVTVYNDTMRSFNRDDEIHLNPDDIDKPDVVGHEYGHAIETMLPGIGDLSFAFLKGRTEGDRLVELSTVMPFFGYGNGEYTYIDAFMSPYMGKSYAGMGTEILSMGMGYLQSTTGVMDMYEQDPEYFGFILSIVSGRAKGVKNVEKGLAVDVISPETIEIDLYKLLNTAGLTRKRVLVRKKGGVSDKIPQEIFDGRVIHGVPYEGDNGIMYDPIDAELSADQMANVVKILDDKGLLKGEKGVKMGDTQIRNVYGRLIESGKIIPEPGEWTIEVRE